MKELKRARIGMKVQIRNGANIGQDHCFGKWEDDNQIVFTIATRVGASRFKLTAPGYGIHEPGQYGNGAVYVKKEDLLQFCGGT